MIKKFRYFGKSLGNRTKPGMSPPLSPLSLGKSAVQTSSAAKVWERTKGSHQDAVSAKEETQRVGNCNPRALSQPCNCNLDSSAPSLLCKSQMKAAACTLHQGATKVPVTGLTRPYSFLDTSLLPNLMSHCLWTPQGLPCSHHGDLLHYDETLCLEDIT